MKTPAPIGILINGCEWSVEHFRETLTASGLDADLVDTREDVDPDDLCRRPFIINRIFASAFHSGARDSFSRIERALVAAGSAEVPVLNSIEAHAFDISKTRSMNALAAAGLAVPRSVPVPADAPPTAVERSIPGDFAWPRILKPDCGGRSSLTWKIDGIGEQADGLVRRPGGSDFIIQEYISPREDFITRIEVIGGKIYLALQRTLAANGLSSYNLGSRYRPYPDCPAPVREAALKAMETLSMEFGSLDIVESTHGDFIIDVNAVSNFTEDNIEAFGCDAVADTARYCAGRFRQLVPGR